MANQIEKVKATPYNCSEMSFEHKPLPGGDAKPSTMSASKKLGLVGASNLRSVAYEAENVFKKIS